MPIQNLKVAVSQDAPLIADANLLAAVLANLLDNARRAGATCCHIEVQAAKSPMWLELRDDGPGLEQSKIDAILDAAMQTQDRGQVGLGIKLAALVARIHGGRLTLSAAPAAEPGLSVRLWLWEDRPAPEPEPPDALAGRLAAPA